MPDPRPAHAPSEPADPITDTGLSVLKDFPALTFLSLTVNKDRITDAGLIHLAECSGLRNVYLKDTVTKPGVTAPAEKLPRCKIIWGGGTIEPTKQLTRLHLNRTVA